MAISNCLFSSTSENPRGFSVWCVLAKLSAKPRNSPYPRGVAHNMTKLLQIILIGLLTLSCNSKKKVVPKTFEEAGLELANYTEEDRMKKLEYLKANVFNGLENLNDGFDSESIYYFSESDFEIVLNRVQKLGIGIMGIEPWLNGEFYDVKVVEDYNTFSTDPKWYQKAFAEFRINKKDLQYAASYEIPKELLAE